MNSRSSILSPLVALVLLLSVAVLRADMVQGAAFISAGAFDSGLGTASGGVFKSISSVGGSAAGNVSNVNYRSYAGVVGSSIRAIDAVISFSDESPSSSEIRTLPSVTVKITVESIGNSIDSVKYRISNSGSGEDGFLDWRTDAVVDPSYAGSSTKKRYMVTFPNTSGDTFTLTDNNYIQWKGRNSGGAEYCSGKYRVRVSSSGGPTVDILQPDVKGATAGTEPLIYAMLRSQSGGINHNTVQIRIDNNVTGANVAVINAATNPDIVTSSGTTASRLYYRYNQTPLTVDVSYKVTVSATDNQGAGGTASVVFTPRGGAIADLVPYPSPFDPKVQPVIIRYVLSKRSTVSVNMYDMSGRLVKNIVDNQSKDAGINEDPWNGSDYSGSGLANGVYFCEVVAKDSDGEHRRYTALAIFGK